MKKLLLITAVGLLSVLPLAAETAETPVEEPACETETVIDIDGQDFLLPASFGPCDEPDGVELCSDVHGTPCSPRGPAGDGCPETCQMEECGVDAYECTCSEFGFCECPF